MKRFSRPSLYGILAIWVCLCCLSACRPGIKGIVYNMPGAKDPLRFPEVNIPASPDPYVLKKDTTRWNLSLEDWAMGKKYKVGMSETAFFEATHTTALLVLKNDTLLYEKYAHGNSQTTHFTTYSMAKIYISALIGIAIQEGKIGSAEDPVYQYLDFFDRDSLMKTVRIRHLLQMTSGVRSSGGFANPWGEMARTYYTRNLDKTMEKVKLKHPPGTHYQYLNTNTQLLAMIVEQATGESISDYLKTRIWDPIGMESDATWNLDRKNGSIKAFCCLNATARDFARFGLAVMNYGYWREKQVLPNDWICEATCFDTCEASAMHYQYQWLTSPEEIDFWGEGLYGQYTYVCPEKNIVIIRLGDWIHLNTPWHEIFQVLAGIDYKPRPIQMEKKELGKYVGEYEFGPSNMGDSTLVGKTAKIRLSKDHLRVKYTSSKNFDIFPESDSLFFNSQYSRKLRFHASPDGTIGGMTWFRDGNEWKLTRKTNDKSARR